ncbi:UDP-N-acetylmuramoyl-L-alanine--D-glutamate ligase, partial [Candidatus Uhrbacteria bacterium]|nr:UDP-N-acetylmuramoyl-L-alanine--D-glutamate ligase [Candidatus Uhrbacteria bacterium]
MNFRGTKVLILGLGRYEQGSGVSAARFFIRHGAEVRVTDKKTAKELGETARALRGRVTMHVGGHRMSDVRWADIVMRNPGVPHDSPYLAAARRRRIPIMTDASLFLELCPCPVIGVTGTRGKSTTTALLGELVRRTNKKIFVGGNIQRSPL